MMDTLWAIYSFVIGAVFGSFLNVCISRWPEGLSVVRPRSRCPKCGHQIGALENIPIFSWLALRGKCRGCGTSISFQYPLVEILVGLIWLGSFLVFGLTFTAANVAMFVTVLFGIAITDAKSYLIPDGFTVFGLVWVIVTSFISLFVNETGPFVGPYEAIIGACVGAGAVAIAGWIGEITLKKEAMGFGDVTLMAVVGAAVGPNRALMTIFLGALVGAVVFIGIVFPIVWMRARASKTEFSPPLIPFGVFLAPAAVIALFWGDLFITSYTRIAGL
ncbi:MAG TPA: prepilin peptidase [Gemmatimonadaceae bacterium]|nr:prepilin peptidase [Gemmatimonadaceae bacterium]